MSDCSHETHKTIDLQIVLDGQPTPSDYPSIPEHLAVSFPFKVYDAPFYQDTPGYCPGDDEVSRGILTNRIWEGHETLLALDILQDQPGIVLDFGCHVGWYSTLAVYTGHTAYAFDQTQENCLMTALNTKGKGEAFCGFIGQGFMLPYSLRGTMNRVTLLKADVEGFERDVVNACAGLFEHRQIDYAFFELSSMWDSSIAGDREPDAGGNTNVRSLCDQMFEWGYECYRIPDKGFQPLDEFSISPLEVVRRDCLMPQSVISEYLTTVNQLDVMFALPEGA